MKNKVLYTIIVIAVVIVGIITFGYFINKSRVAKQTQILTAGLQPQALDVVKKDTLPIQITINEGQGHIVESYKAGEDPGKVIIHIQDIHTNYEAQKNMSNIIEALIKEKNLKLIMVEGGWGDVSLSYLRKDESGQPIFKERRLKVAEDYLKEGKISGEEYLNIVSDYDMDLQGIEEEVLYKENLDIFFKIETFRQRGTQAISELKEITEALKQKMYPPVLLELEKKRSEYNEEDITLAEFYNYLAKLAGDKKLDTSEFKNFDSFIKIIKLEEKIDFARVEKQRAGLIEKISKLLSKDKLAPLVAKSLEFRLNKISPAEYHVYLKQISQEAGINIANYEDLEKYIEYIKSHEEINTNTLFKEADILEKRIKDVLTQDRDQKTLQELSRQLEIIDNFLNLKLIPEDFTYYKGYKDNFLISQKLPFLEENIKKYKLKYSLPQDTSVLDNNLATLVEFYDIANKRDQIFIQKAASLMNEKKQNLAVLIAGGFHTPNLTQMFKDNSISYVVVAPKTTEKTDPELYRYILQYKSGKAE